ncbi:hypothetical protein FHX77_001298 [Bifidobacterium commune]|uniref:Putative membrane protein insertion efficiency factor n=1 Tax=Bifidobacterium commune TaxID=1505727 RepID=A0A1C4H5Z5_9BIFI|nr:hypothetical protein [Bifidobacterium commune]SCC80366.1 putative membrane protein insertion efficiency factor [Bifidobacterium commune]
MTITNVSQICSKQRNFNNSRHLETCDDANGTVEPKSSTGIGKVNAFAVPDKSACAVVSTSPAARAILAAIRWYQRHISAGNPPCCKYYPSCSNYAVQAVTRYGAVRGGLLAALRLLRCRPWSNGGIDDVPQHYSVFYRFSWSRAHEEPRLTPLASDMKETA